jgi:hypothetical protein
VARPPQIDDVWDIDFSSFFPASVTDCGNGFIDNDSLYQFLGNPLGEVLEKVETFLP